MARQGVYCIYNLKTKKRYIGSASKSLTKRLWQHRRSLNFDRHYNKYLQAAWNKYGESSFEFLVLEKCHPDDCIAREQFWMDKFQSYKKPFGYNFSPTAGSPRGVRHSKATRKKVSMALKGKAKTKEHVAAMKVAKQNMSVETKKKMSVYAKKRSPEHQRKLSLTKIGNKNCVGIVVSEERKRKISVAAKLRWAKWRKEGRDIEIGKLVSKGRKKAKLRRMRNER